MKRFIFSLFVLCFCFFGVGFCNYYVSDYQTLVIPGVATVSFDTGLCIMGTNFGNVYITDNSNHFVLQGRNSNTSINCFDFAGKIWSDVSVATNLRIYTGIYNFFSSSDSCSCPDCPSCPSTGEILSGYVPSSLLNECESDLLACESNTSGFNSLLNTCSSDLNACNTSLSSCLQNNCPEITGLVNWSELKINDIVHQSAPFINITIPEEFDWNYTVDENEFDLSVSGYNVDTEYIDGIIRLQNTKPSNSDFNKIVSELLPAFVPGLVIILFIYFIFRFVKKIF